MTRALLALVCLALLSTLGAWLYVVRTPERPQMRVSVQYCLRHAGVFRAVFSLDDTSVIMVCNDGSLQPYIGQYTDAPR